jgi:hypothetical protein
MKNYLKKLGIENIGKHKYIRNCLTKNAPLDLNLYQVMTNYPGN